MNFIQEKLSKMRISRKIALSFVVVILMGAFLLTLPISNRGWTWLKMCIRDRLWVGFPYGLIVGLGVVLVISSQCLKIHAVSVIIKKTGIAANVE